MLRVRAAGAALGLQRARLATGVYGGVGPLIAEQAALIHTPAAGTAPAPTPGAQVAQLQQAPADGHVLQLDAARRLLSTPVLVMQRRREILANVFGFEVANSYGIFDGATGELLGHLIEEDGFASGFSRQVMRSHRAMKASVTDASGAVLFHVARPAYAFASTLNVTTLDKRAVGTVAGRWHALRRRYDLFTNVSGYLRREDGDGRDDGNGDDGNGDGQVADLVMRQFGRVDAPMLSWDFPVCDIEGRQVARVDKEWTNIARELFTDGNMYAVRFNTRSEEQVDDALCGDDLDRRATILGLAVSIDFDYFSIANSHGIYLPDSFSSQSRAPVHDPGPGPTPLPGEDHVDDGQDVDGGRVASESNVASESGVEDVPSSGNDFGFADAPPDFADESAEETSDSWWSFGDDSYDDDGGDWGGGDD